MFQIVVACVIVLFKMDQLSIFPLLSSSFPSLDYLPLRSYEQKQLFLYTLSYSIGKWEGIAPKAYSEDEMRYVCEICM